MPRLPRFAQPHDANAQFHESTKAAETPPAKAPDPPTTESENPLPTIIAGSHANVCLQPALSRSGKGTSDIQITVRSTHSRQTFTIFSIFSGGRLTRRKIFPILSDSIQSTHFHPAFWNHARQR